MKLSELIKNLFDYVKIGESDPKISAVENDHRKVTSESLFICVKGYTVDGHDFAETAVAKGAVAIICTRELNLSSDTVQIIVEDTQRIMAHIASRFYGFPTKHLNLVGITGTNGKTTVSQIIEQIISANNLKTGLIGTIYNKIGNEIIDTVNTTPDSLTLQKLFYKMCAKKTDTAIMEVSSHAVALGRTHECDFDIAVFTNLTSDHLDFHGTVANYKLAKSMLFSKLGNSFEKVAILNADDKASAFFKSLSAAQVITYGINNTATITATNIKLSVSKTQFLCVTPACEFNVTTNLIGIFNIYNILSAIAVALVMKIDIKKITETLLCLKTIPGRFEAIESQHDFSVIVDYAHSADSLQNVLTTIQSIGAKKVYTVVGCGGERDTLKRPEMAQIACQLSDYAIFTSDNPRNEPQKQIFSDMTTGLIKDNYCLIEDRKEAIKHALTLAKNNDVVLIAGKGHEDYQIIGNKKTPFDDRKVARQLLELI